MKRLVALLFGATAGLVTVRLLRRRRAAAGALPGSGEPDLDATGGADDQASELRRKLDAARERAGDSGAEEQLEQTQSGSELSGDESAEVPGDALASGDAPADLADKRSRVHDRARDAAESMRSDDGAA